MEFEDNPFAYFDDESIIAMLGDYNEMETDEYLETAPLLESDIAAAPTNFDARDKWP